jgi:AraC family transcriptional regulator of adaptative response / DNA-3-methyladenine glycosylase II
MLDGDVCYRALVARDVRFDGVFFVAVKTTGIYCRPICPARTPGRDRCVFYTTPAAAERDGFRACFRCRPELSPGSAPIDSVSRVVAAAMQHIDAGLPDGASLERVAAELGVTARHLRRSMRTELGLSPVELLQSRRLSLAKRLVHDTDLSMTEVAFASGFRSVRRFNALFRARHGRAPSDLRRARPGAAPAADTVMLRLDYRPPYDWEAMLGFLRERAVPGVEMVRDGAYHRTVRIGSRRGWVRVVHDERRHALRAEASLSLTLALMPLVARLRRMFDLDAQPEAIAAHLGRDPHLAKHVRRRPGVRLPGALHGFETALRAVLGQQVSVAAATTLAGRLYAARGEPITTPYPELNRLTPLAEPIAETAESDLTVLGIPKARAHTLRAVAQAVATDAVDFETVADPERLIDRLLDLPGIGPWTAHYIAMRGLGWPDAFPDGDLGVCRALGDVSPRRLREMGERWRPWRAYAVMQLWNSLSKEKSS